MIILAIETSCDETAVALYDSTKEPAKALIAEKISSQVKLHQEYGGVVPELAAREHLANLPLLVQMILAENSLTIENVSEIAVTAGPGLKGCLLMGTGFAEGLAKKINKKPLAINHIEAHLFSAFVGRENPEYPFLALIVSGGHTEIVKVDALEQYQVLARTLDDAAGEAYDKAANLLDLGYPGGPRLAALADTVSESEFYLPKVMREAAGFSFSGLKTAISLLIQRQKQLGKLEEAKARLAFAIQAAINDALVFKVKEELQNTGIKRLVLTGGVSANKDLQQRLQALSGITVSFPRPEHYTDNAAMVAYLAALKINNDKQDRSVFVRPRWWLESFNN